jgi:Leucine-rich repeat (LRR) protein
MAREEALTVQREQQIENIGGQSNLLRRLSIESTESMPVEWAALQKLVSLRVLIINCKINFKTGDSLSSFSSLRVLHIVRLSESYSLVRSLCQLKHLRYLYLYDSDISRLPDDIDRMKFLQYIGIVNCKRFVQLPDNIIKLRQLRSLDLVGSSVDVVPRGFGSLTKLRSLFGFPVHTDDKDQGWCSLEELAPLYLLRSLRHTKGGC